LLQLIVKGSQYFPGLIPFGGVISTGKEPIPRGSGAVVVDSDLTVHPADSFLTKCE
jgi:hypothetical protein